MESAQLIQMLERFIELADETTLVEFKSNWKKAQDIGEYISAMANAALLAQQGQAWVVWGVDDATHEIKGTRFDPFKQKVGNQGLIMWLQQKTSPKADFEFHKIKYQDLELVVLEIRRPRSAPIAFENQRYIRIDSNKTRLSQHPDKESRIWNALGMKQDWSGEIVSEATLDDLDSDAIESARKRFVEFLLKNETDAERQTTIKEDAAGWDNATLLNKARITKAGKITRSALLLLGKDESSHFLSPVDAKISWILRESDGKTRSSQPFSPPWLLNSDQLFTRIRNLSIEEMPDGTLFPVAIQQYDNWVIREALHNCIAHQDYSMGGKVNVVEYPDRLIFTNLGQFIPQSVEWMLENQSPPEHYRNQWLIDGMIRLRMIEQVGSGIRRMFETQKERLLPLPDYELNEGDFTHPRVQVTIQGRILDERYTKLLMKHVDLSLKDVMSLDKIQKQVSIPKGEAQRLRKLGLIEGRYPRIFVSGQIAASIGGQATHIRQKGFDNEYYRDLLEKLIREHGPVSPKVINELIIDKLPDSMTEAQKRKKIRNLTTDLSQRRKSIENIGNPRGPGALWTLRDSQTQ
ncbi:MAG: putative DNA binding domain-containing protein [Opitutales bacterium]|nr:putative DNA binding domain-containing protein [Opitutales bacterium]MCH8540837.1 putative DNA binding domain-containing protein [Opitutales bacterium]